MRIAIGGFQHETNTFADSCTSYDDFLQTDVWPGLVHGDKLLETFASVPQIPIAGFIQEATNLKMTLEPLLWCSAPPGGLVEQEAFDNIVKSMLYQLSEVKNQVDAVYLDLHGAMVTTELEDAEGELLQKIRAEVGRDIPIVVSLDLHANITGKMVETTDFIHCYRTYPHIDMLDTGSAVAKRLHKLLDNDKKANIKAFKKLPILISLPWQNTLIEPAKSIYKELPKIEKRTNSQLSFAEGFPLADIKECGPSIVGYAQNTNDVLEAVESLEKFILERKNEFDGKFWDYKDAVSYAIDKSKTNKKPIILADTQDNPGGGGSSDVVEILKELVKNDAKDAIVAIVYDPAAAEYVHNAGIGSEVELSLGGQTNLQEQSSMLEKFTVEKLSDGKFTGTGPFYGGCEVDLGPMAVLKIKDVKVIIASKRMQAADRAIFSHLGIKPESMKILVLKSSVHFFADFEKLASEVLMTIAPGFNTATLSELDYRNIKHPMISVNKRTKKAS